MIKINPPQENALGTISFSFIEEDKERFMRYVYQLVKANYSIPCELSSTLDLLLQSLIPAGILNHVDFNEPLAFLHFIKMMASGEIKLSPYTSDEESRQLQHAFQSAAIDVQDEAAIERIRQIIQDSDLTQIRFRITDPVATSMTRCSTPLLEVTCTSKQFDLFAGENAFSQLLEIHTDWMKNDSSITKDRVTNLPSHLVNYAAQLVSGNYILLLAKLSISNFQSYFQLLQGMDVLLIKRILLSEDQPRYSKRDRLLIKLIDACTSTQEFSQLLDWVGSDVCEYAAHGNSDYREEFTTWLFAKNSSRIDYASVFLNYVSWETVLFFNNKSSDPQWFGLDKAATIFSAIMNKMEDADCEQFALRQTADDRTGLWKIIEKIPQITIPFMRRLSPEVLERALLLEGTYQDCALYSMLAKARQPNNWTWRLFLQELARNTEFLGKIKSPVRYLDLLSNLNEKEFIDKINTMDQGVCEQLALPVLSRTNIIRESGTSLLAQVASASVCAAFFKRLSPTVRFQSLLERIPISNTTIHEYLSFHFNGQFESLLFEENASEYAMIPDVSGNMPLAKCSHSTALFERIFNLIPPESKLPVLFHENADEVCTFDAFMNESYNQRDFICDMIMAFIQSDTSRFKRFMEENPKKFMLDSLRKRHPLVIFLLQDFFSHEQLGELMKLEDKSGDFLLHQYLNLNTRSPQNIASWLRILPTKTAIDAFLQSNTRLQSVFDSRTNARISWSKCYQLSLISQYPEFSGFWFEKEQELSLIQFYDRGISKDRWSLLAKSLQPTVDCTLRKIDNGLTAQINQRLDSAGPLPSFDLSHLLESGRMRFLRFQGRTILFKDETKKELLALKIQKLSKSETVRKLRSECATIQVLTAHQQTLRLKSILPTPIAVVEIKGITAALAQQNLHNDEFNALIGQSDREVHAAYLYTATPDYFTYLHDPALPEKAFNHAVSSIIHDLMVLLAHGMIFPELADLFHNQEDGFGARTDQGLYRVLANLLVSHLNGGGGGRVNDALGGAIEYLNMRASGLADLGDHLSIRDYIKHTPHYQDVRDSFKGKAGNVLLANYLAEIQYIIQLAAGRRACHLEESILEAESKAQDITDLEVVAKIPHVALAITSMWQAIATQLVKNCALTLSMTTFFSKEEAERFLFRKINVERLATQMQYWMTSAYINDIKNNKIRDDIYGSGVEVVVDKSKIRVGTFHDDIGCSINGKTRDLGMVNGQEPIKEGDKLRYWMIILIYNAFHQENYTRKDILAIIRESDPFQSNVLRTESFLHLTPKPYHRYQHMLCKRQLGQPATPEHLRERLLEESRQHQLEYTALTLQGMWRRKRSLAPKLPVEVAESTESTTSNSNQAASSVGYN